MRGGSGTKGRVGVVGGGKGRILAVGGALEGRGGVREGVGEGGGGRALGRKGLITYPYKYLIILIPK